MEEGYIKYNCEFIEDVAPEVCLVKELIHFREKLYESNLIGMRDGVGFGNISVRYNNAQFIITGTQTGHLKTLLPEHFSIVTAYSFEENYVCCRGKVRASSEALTHAIIYEKLGFVNAVFHIHSLKHWKRLLGKVPTASEKAKFGTVELVYEIVRLINSTDLARKRILVTAGHEEGIITFGGNVEEAFNILVVNNIIQL